MIIFTQYKINFLIFEIVLPGEQNKIQCWNQETENYNRRNIMNNLNKELEEQ